MVSPGKQRYFEWKERHPDTFISHIIIEEDGDVFNSFYDGNVYFDGTLVPDTTIFGDLYILIRENNIDMKKFIIRGTLCFTGIADKTVHLHGFKKLLENDQNNLFSNVIVHS